MTIIFKIKGQPPRATAQQKGARRTRYGIVFYEKDSVKAAREWYTLGLKKHRPEEPIHGPVAISVWYEYGTDDKKKIGTWKTTRPDTDNLIKALKDTMTDLGFWDDDSQVADERIRKKWTTKERAGVTIVIDTLKDREESEDE